jgi:hypothetical protein
MDGPKTHLILSDSIPNIVFLSKMALDGPFEDVTALFKDTASAMPIGKMIHDKSFNLYDASTSKH